MHGNYQSTLVFRGCLSRICGKRQSHGLQSGGILTVAIIALALISGLLIGCIGVGGVLLVPVLSFLGIDVHAAIAASLFAFIFSGVIGTYLFARHGSIDITSSLWLGAGAMPGAFAGALLAAWASADLLLLGIGAAVIFAGARSFMHGRGEPPTAAPLPPTMLAMIGCIVGALSSLTGTGGPLLLVPLLLALRAPVLPAIGLAQAIQLPIAILASIGNLFAGTLDAMLAGLVSAGIILGTMAGAMTAHTLPKPFLTRLVAVVLLVVGAFVMLRASHLIA